MIKLNIFQGISIEYLSLMISYLLYIIINKKKISFRISFCLLLITIIFPGLNNFLYGVYIVIIIIKNYSQTKKIVTIDNILLFLSTILTILIVNLISFIINHIVSNKFTDLTFVSTIACLISLLSCLLFVYIHTSINIKNKLLLYIKSKKFIYIIFYSYLTLLILILSISILAEILQIEATLQGIFIIIFLAMTIIFCITTSFLTYYYIKNEKIEVMKREIVNRQNYLNDLTTNYSNLRKIKHDIKNLLIPLNRLLLDQKYDQATGYIKALLSYIDEIKTEKSSEYIKVLSRLKNLELQGLFIEKLAYAQKHGIKLDIQITNDVKLKAKDIINTIIILSNLLDNAIDATINHKDSYIFIEIIQHSKSIEFKITNSLLQPINLYQIKKEGYTTKKSHLGIGMTNVFNIINTSQNYFIEIDNSRQFITFNFIII